MIPLKLQIKNFLSYGPELQTIDFSPYPLICLSGKNGHGKSALLDAITWAIWGHARKISSTSKADQGLLHLGQSSMMVSLDFECNQTTYRIKREFSFINGKAHAALEFGLVQPETDYCVPLTDKTIRGTQHVIEKTIHLDYDSFINSAFLRQGQSNEFSKKSPKERKQILATILGLDRYDSIRKLALEKSKHASAEKTMLSALQEKYVNQLKHAPQLEQQLAELARNIDQVSVQEHNLTAQIKEINQRLEELYSAQKKLDLLSIQATQKKDAESELLQKFRQSCSQWRDTEKTKRAYPDLDNQEKEYRAKQIKLAEYQESMKSLIDLKQESLAISSTLKNIEQKIIHQRMITQRESEQIAQRHASDIQICTERIVSLEKERNNKTDELSKATLQIERVSHELKQLSYDQAAVTLFEKQFERRKDFFQKYVAQGSMLTKELQQLEKKQVLVHNEEDPSCPLCEQNLSAARKRFLKQKYASDKSFLTHRIERLARVTKKLRSLLIEQHDKKIDFQKKRDQFLSLSQSVVRDQETINSLSRAIALIDQALASEQVNRARLKQLYDDAINAFTAIKPVHNEDLMADGEYFILHTILAEKEASIAKLAPRANDYEQLIREIKELEGVMTLQTTIKEQYQLQPIRMKEIHELSHRIKQLRREQVSLALEMAQFADVKTTIEGFKLQIVDLQSQLDAFRAHKERLFQEKGSLTGLHTQYQSLQQEYQAHQKRLEQIEESIEDYYQLAQAAGKDGIQALLIEEAIPEIEQEANTLLSKLTDNQAHIVIESLRDLKKGGTKETLDIKISDAAGIRPYELFSGGEAFRIDFALRVAISKLLARRAGTALQTLIIDEGFGSQDDDGLNHIMDTIYKIQDDFPKIIIVSHLPSMKDQFPVHFMIEKKPYGSSVRVFEQA